MSATVWYNKDMVEIYNGNSHIEQAAAALDQHVRGIVDHALEQCGGPRRAARALDRTLETLDPDVSDEHTRPLEIASMELRAIARES